MTEIEFSYQKSKVGLCAHCLSQTSRGKIHVDSLPTGEILLRCWVDVLYRQGSQVQHSTHMVMAGDGDVQS